MSSAVRAASSPRRSPSGSWRNCCDDSAPLLDQSPCMLGRCAVVMRTTPTDAVLDGRYQVLAHLGTGGMAEVYCAQDLQLGRKVALKILYRRFAEDGEVVERFRRAAPSAAG